MLTPPWGYTASISVSDMTTLSQFYASKIEKSQKMKYSMSFTIANMTDVLVVILST